MDHSIGTNALKTNPWNKWRWNEVSRIKKNEWSSLPERVPYIDLFMVNLGWPYISIIFTYMYIWISDLEYAETVVAFLVASSPSLGLSMEMSGQLALVHRRPRHDGQGTLDRSSSTVFIDIYKAKEGSCVSSQWNQQWHKSPYMYTILWGPYIYIYVIKWFLMNILGHRSYRSRRPFQNSLELVLAHRHNFGRCRMNSDNEDDMVVVGVAAQ